MQNLRIERGTVSTALADKSRRSILVIGGRADLLPTAFITIDFSSFFVRVVVFLIHLFHYFYQTGP
jgi:hypothetical protein